MLFRDLIEFPIKGEESCRLRLTVKPTSKGKISQKMSESIEIRPIFPKDTEQVLEFLRENFFPFEPCAQNIDLCPLGYKIPALEESIVETLAKEYSIGAFNGKELIGLSILDEKVIAVNAFHQDNQI